MPIEGERERERERERVRARQRATATHLHFDVTGSFTRVVIFVEKSYFWEILAAMRSVVARTSWFECSGFGKRVTGGALPPGFLILPELHQSSSTHSGFLKELITPASVRAWVLTPAARIAMSTPRILMKGFSCSRVLVSLDRHIYGF